MATSNNITHDDEPAVGIRQSATSITRCPTITIPPEFKLLRWGGVAFDIHTARGIIQVEARKFEITCKGMVAALAAHRLLQEDWLPGIAENNKTCQRVAFVEKGPYLISGNLRGTRVPESHITIQRRSARLYTVSIPPTHEQKEFLREAEKTESEKTKHFRFRPSAKEVSPNIEISFVCFGRCCYWRSSYHIYPRPESSHVLFEACGPKPGISGRIFKSVDRPNRIPYQFRHYGLTVIISNKK